MDPCFYRRDDALIIVHVDDMRVAADPDTLTTLHVALFDHFQITTSDGTRFLGMDVDYNRELGVLKMSMKTYLQSTLDRFTAFDVSRGCPYREIVRCLLWIHSLPKCYLTQSPLSYHDFSLPKCHLPQSPLSYHDFSRCVLPSRALSSPLHASSSSSHVILPLQFPPNQSPRSPSFFPQNLFILPSHWSKKILFLLASAFALRRVSPFPVPRCRFSGCPPLISLPRCHVSGCPSYLHPIFPPPPRPIYPNLLLPHPSTITLHFHPIPFSSRFSPSFFQTPPHNLNL